MIELVNVTKRFDEKVLFNNLNLKIEDGSFVVIFGASGCGKTTLLNIIGLFDYCEGEVLIDGVNYEPRSKQARKLYKDKIGYVLQNFGLVSDLTVLENMKIISRDKEKIMSTLNKYDIAEKLESKVYTLSGGEQQRVALSMIDLKDADIILADEPTGSLDTKNRDYVIGVLKEFQSKGKTVIVVTHDKEFLDYASKSVKIQ